MATQSNNNTPFGRTVTRLGEFIIITIKVRLLKEQFRMIDLPNHPEMSVSESFNKLRDAIYQLDNPNVSVTRNIVKTSGDRYITITFSSVRHQNASFSEIRKLAEAEKTFQYFLAVYNKSAKLHLLSKAEQRLDAYRPAENEL